MHQIHEKVFSTEEVDFLRTLWQECIDTGLAESKDPPSDSDRSLRIFLNRKNCQHWPTIENMVKKIDPTAEEKSIVFFCERQYQPTDLHVDPDNLYRTCVIPLSSDCCCETLLWQQKYASKKEFTNFIIEFDPWMKTKVNNITMQSNIPHTYDINKEVYLAEYQDLEAVFCYRAGDAFFFDSKQMHCSSDWRNCNGMEYKDFAGFHLQYL